MLLYAITQGSSHPRSHDVLPHIRRAAECGIDLLQIREKELSARELYELVRSSVALARQISHGKMRILVNDRMDIALAAGADGVHVPSQGMPVQHLRALAPPGFLLARSCHHADEVYQAAGAGADFCVLGPIFFTPSKAGMGAPIGPGALEAARGAGIPVLALGGVDLANAADCRRHGAAGIAAIRLFQQPDLPEVVTTLRRLT